MSIESAVKTIQDNDLQALQEALTRDSTLVKSVDDGQNSLLMIAAFHGRSEMIKALLEAGSDINHANYLKENALMFATAGNHYAAAELLLNAGADINSKDENGDTALIYAARKGNTSAATFLLLHKAPIDEQAEDGKTALIIAAAQGNARLVDTLCKHNADMDLTDKFGYTALQWAKELPFPETARILQEKIERSSYSVFGFGKLRIVKHKAKDEALKISVQCQLENER